MPNSTRTDRKFNALNTINPDKYVIIDLDSGVVIGTNVVVAPWPTRMGEQQKILTSKDAAQTYGAKKGRSLYFRGGLAKWKGDLVPEKPKSEKSPGEKVDET